LQKFVNFNKFEINSQDSQSMPAARYNSKTTGDCPRQLAVEQLIG